MIPENGTIIKNTILQSSNQQTHLTNILNTIPPSPQHTCTQKYSSQQTDKNSEELLNKIYALIQQKQGLKRKDSIKSLKTLEKKQSTNNFKCKCKKTKCLKMYCQCFAVGKLCNGCHCCDCQNLLEFQEIRATAIDQALERDPDIFQLNTIIKKGGCICKKTQCLKKYCECFSSGIPCTSQCKCQNCCNTQ